MYRDSSYEIDCIMALLRAWRSSTEARMLEYAQAFVGLEP